MILQDNRRADLKKHRSEELKKANDIASLLNDMLNNFNPNESTDDDVTVIKELHSSCKSLQISISRCAADNDELLRSLIFLFCL